jgi:magnesium transporter
MVIKHPICLQEAQLWIDLENPDQADIDQLGLEYNIAAIYLQDVMQPEHLPKWEYADDDDLYFVLGRYADPDAPKTADTIHAMTRKLAVFMRPGQLITIHRGRVPFLEELRQKTADSNGRYKTVEQLLCRLLKEIFVTYETLVGQNSSELEYYEGKVLQTRHITPFLRGLFLVRRRSSVIRKVLLLSKHLPDALRALELNPSQIQDTRDMVVRVETLSDDLHERSASLISMHLALADQRANQVMKVLTLFSAFFLPVTFIAGVYGMNFDNMPELHTANGYFATLGVMASVCLCILIWFRRARWI